MNVNRLFAFLFIVSAFQVSLNAESPTGWSPVILPTGAYRAQIQAMPIHERPGRPFHIYGNTIRLIHQSNRSQPPTRPLRQIVFGTPVWIGPPALR
ncbi:hypothetical protein Poly24_29920 [Rosistilla carotiformis]|uniref:Uncharacterized protein n=1 Tax=Rosistilla carotiformis TaxID=2528017 RepID=A0A518JUQ9_9BACT|nr:hypothetical protein [Rosistilla carotiformis]QDV69277.1 hypothetical protein Poly24_29920 [Rosistilla carotiformis]